MKFYKLYNLTLNEMARASKSALFGKVKVNSDVRATPANITNIKMYLLDQFSDDDKAKIFNNIIDFLKDAGFESYEDLYRSVLNKVSDEIKSRNGKQNSTKLKYTTRVVFNTLSKLKVLEPLGSTTTTVTSDPTEASAEVEASAYTINNTNYLDQGIDKLYSFPPSVLDPIGTFFEQHDGETMPIMKIKLAIQNEVKQYLEGKVGEDEQDALMQKLKRDNMSELIIKLKSAGALETKQKQKPSPDAISPILDPDEDEVDTISDVERLTGGFGPSKEFDPYE